MTLDEAVIANQWLKEKYPDWSIEISRSTFGYTVTGANKKTKLDKLSVVITASWEWVMNDKSAPKFSVNLYCNHKMILNVTGNLVTDTLEAMQYRFKSLAAGLLPKGSLVALKEDFETLCLT